MNVSREVENMSMLFLLQQLLWAMNRGAPDSVCHHPAGYRICWIVEKIRPG